MAIINAIRNPDGIYYCHVACIWIWTRTTGTITDPDSGSVMVPVVLFYLVKQYCAQYVNLATISSSASVSVFRFPLIVGRPRHPINIFGEWHENRMSKIPSLICLRKISWYFASVALWLVDDCFYHWFYKVTNWCLFNPISMYRYIYNIW